MYDISVHTSSLYNVDFHGKLPAFRTHQQPGRTAFTTTWSRPLQTVLGQCIVLCIAFTIRPVLGLDCFPYAQNVPSIFRTYMVHIQLPGCRVAFRDSTACRLHGVDINTQRIAHEKQRRKAAISRALHRLESICDGRDDTAYLDNVINSQRDIYLPAVHTRTAPFCGVPTLDGEPCEHCGAKRFAKESKAIVYVS